NPRICTSPCLKHQRLVEGPITFQSTGPIRPASDRPVVTCSRNQVNGKGRTKSRQNPGDRRSPNDWIARPSAVIVRLPGQRHVTANVTKTEGQRNTPTPLAQSTPSGPNSRPASDADSVITANAASDACATRRTGSG